MLHQVLSPWGSISREKASVLRKIAAAQRLSRSQSIMANEKSSGMQSSTQSDPMLLGVPVPLNLTMSKASEIGMAWRECMMALMAAAKTKMAAKPAANSTPSTTPQTPTVSA
jgi:hypothetical protein